MSTLASDLLELRRLSEGGAGALTKMLLHEVAAALIAAGIRNELGGL